MSEIILSRLPKIWGDLLRNYSIYIDGARVGEIGNASTVKLNVDPGRHKLQLRIDWCRSRELEFDIQEHAVKKFECRGNVNPLLVLLYISIFKNDYIGLWEVGD